MLNYKKMILLNVPSLVAYIIVLVPIIIFIILLVLETTSIKVRFKREKIIKERIQIVSDRALFNLALPTGLINKHHISCYQRAIKRMEKLI